MATLSATLSSDTTWGGSRLGSHVSNETFGVAVGRFGAATSSTTYPPIKLWGTQGSVALTDSTRQREMDDMMAVGGLCPRYDASVGTIPNLLISTGFTRWVGIADGSGNFPSNSTLITYAQTYPQAIIDTCNEPNNSTTYTPEEVAAKQISAYAALRGAGCTNTILSPDISNGTGPWGTPLAYVARLAAAGCVAGSAFDWASYHAYDGNIASYDASYLHAWTADGSSHSMQNYFGSPPFLVTEFGYPESQAGSQAEQAAGLKRAMNTLKGLDKCMGGQWYGLSNDCPGTGTGYGLRNTNLTHKAAWDTFVAAVATPNTT